MILLIAFIAACVLLGAASPRIGKGQIALIASGAALATVLYLSVGRLM
jgi:hypothetical protein